MRGQALQDWLEKAARSAIDVPASGIEAEAWIARNLAEVCLFTIALGGSPAPVDSSVSAMGGGLPGPGADRLRRLREHLGEVPSQYASADVPPPPITPFGNSDSRAAELLSEYAASLHSEDAALQDVISVQNGVGAAKIKEYATARGIGEHAFQVLDTGLAPDLLWRAWTFLPGTGPLMLAPKEELDPATMDIWWGIHNGFHLDHMASLAAQRSNPMAVEYGEGMLVTESLTMVGEILAGARARLSGSTRHMAVVASGIRERILRHPGNPAAVEKSIEVSRKEFAWLPTVASAYVSGPIDLIASNFESHFIPAAVSNALLAQWATLESQDSSLRLLRQRAQEGTSSAG
ncbi:hypothetical protein [Paenarthrobacter ureafaciens]|uniref:hypothetical protein n=1 Tax=Paenarthrobacter ureafaciens TaxID=37931 RepID=UPI0008A6ED36|nr:hypothetical protein ARZXY2_4869 [Arthrobacter sp. ZXY-2]